MDQNEKKNTEQWQKRQLVLALIATAVLAVMVGTLAWLNYNRRLQTATLVDMPNLIIRGPFGSDSVPIELGDIDVTAGENYRCVFSITASKADAYRLQLAHTTNLPFTYTIYPAVLQSSKPEGKSVYESGNYYSYSTAMGGNYLNKDATTGLAITDTENAKSKHEITYGSYNHVQKNAEPLYWQSNSVAVESANRDYYVLEIHWGPGLTNNKETDMVYLTVETALDEPAASTAPATTAGTTEEG